MKKLLLSFVLFALALTNISAQLDCNQDYATTLNSNGEAEILISDLVPNIEFMLTQGTVTYYVFPLTFGTVNSAMDVIPLTCDNRGLPAYVIEVESGGSLVDNCTGELVITSPNGGCPGDNPDVCGDTPNCYKVLGGYFLADNTNPNLDIYAIDYALCEDALGCGTYGIAYGLLSDNASLSFGNSISSADATQYKNPVTISYTENSITGYTQSYLYVWANAECILKSDYRTFYELDITAEAEITPANLLSGDEVCDNVGLALTGLSDPEPLGYSSSITVNCDNIGQKLVWIRNIETGFTISKVVQIRDPLEACGTVLGPGDKLVNYTAGIEGLLFNTNIEINGTTLPRHPGGIGYILNEDNLVDGSNTMNFISDSYSLNGVSTLDLVLGSRIILFDIYDDPKESVLFDIDQSGYNGIGDMILMREIILGMNSGEGIPDAYFFNNSYEFPSDFDPFDFENNFTEFTFDKADFGTVDLSFEARKVGDLNLTAIPGIVEKDKDVSETRSDGPEYQVTDMYVEAGQEFTFDLKYESEEKFKGLLAGLVGDGLEFKSLNKDEVDIESPSVDYNIINDFEIRILYRNPNSNAELNEITFTITAKATKAGELVDLLGLKHGFPQEVIGEGNTVTPVDDISIITSTSVTITGLSVQVDLFPNPAHNTINISSENSALKQVSIVDALGRRVLVKNLSSNKEILNISDFANGLYHMMITTEDGMQAATFVKE